MFRDQAHIVRPAASIHVPAVFVPVEPAEAEFAVVFAVVAEAVFASAVKA